MFNFEEFEDVIVDKKDYIANLVIDNGDFDVDFDHSEDIIDGNIHIRIRFKL